MADHGCKCTVGYYKRFDRPLQKIDGLPRYNNIASIYAQEYKRKETGSLNKMPQSDIKATKHKNVKPSTALPLGYKTSYEHNFWAKAPQPDHRDE